MDALVDDVGALNSMMDEVEFTLPRVHYKYVTTYLLTLKKRDMS